MEGEYTRNKQSREGMDMEKYVRETLGSLDQHRNAAPLRRLRAQAAHILDAVALRVEILKYRYYNWRRDTGSDLFLILVLNAFVVAAGAALKLAVVDPALKGTQDDPSEVAAEALGVDRTEVTWLSRLWPDLYQVILLTFGENFPNVNESWQLELYSVAMGFLGVIGFALLLALTEQVILEVLTPALVWLWCWILRVLLLLCVAAPLCCC